MRSKEYGKESMNLFELHNARRIQWGREPLKQSDELDELANNHAKFISKTWMPWWLAGHWGFRRRYKCAQEAGFSRAAENVAYGYVDNNEVMQNWMWSQGHRDNIMGEYTHIGIGAAFDNKGQTYWCVLFAK